MASTEKRQSKALAQKVAKFKRGDGVHTKQIADKKLKGRLQHVERLAQEAAEAAARAEEWLLPAEAGGLEAEGMEQTWRFQQEALVQEAEAGAARKAFDLRLEGLGPYNLDFSRSGRHLLIGGRKGHLGLMEWQTGHTFCEVQVKETVRDVQFLHNEQFFAAAQKKYVYIYDKRGLEVHCLRDHTDTRRLDFLPHHFLLTSVGAQGVLRYQDTSTGHIVAQHKTKMGPCDVLRHNPYNGVSLLGHANGTVTMWAPNTGTPLVKMLVHRGSVKSLAADATGRHLVTTGTDSQVCVWDLRTFKPLHSYFSRAPAEWCDVSQRGMLAVGWGRKVSVWRDALARKQAAPYLSHTLLGGALRDFQFCPYEDVLAVGHTGGISTMLVPGAGEPNFDSYVADPFQGKRARQEQEVHQLLDKLKPEMIVLDPTTIGQVQKEPREVQAERRAQQEEAERARRKQQRDKNESKAKMKGKNRPSKRHRKKQTNIIEERKGQLQQRMDEEAKRRAAKAEREAAAVPEGVPKALERFYKGVRR
eukprot:jgi/Astpho2/3549/fgenesh1_pm.00057_%23_8_t